MTSRRPGTGKEKNSSLPPEMRAKDVRNQNGSEAARPSQICENDTGVPQALQGNPDFKRYLKSSARLFLNQNRSLQT